MLNDKEVEELLINIFEGKTTVDKLPVELYDGIAQFLEKGLLKGAGGPVTSFDGKDLDLIQELRANIYMFSAAKTYEEVRGFSELIYNDEDKIRPFEEFFADARAKYDTYNVDYARTEYNTAVASGQMGIRWNQIVKDADTLPLLKMTVVEDAQTTEICEPLDGITLPIGDPFWDEFYPPNHWNCRSTVLQLDEGDISTKAQVEKAVEHADEEMQDVFKMNVGKDEFVFSPEHPYFTNAPREAREANFDLPMPKDLPPSFTPATSIPKVKAAIAKLFEEEGGFQVKSVEAASTLTLDEMNDRYKALKDLLADYMPSPVNDRSKPLKIAFKSTDTMYGAVKSIRRTDNSLIWIDRANFGNRTDAFANRKYIKGFEGLREKSRVDERNNSIATVVHEFFHVMTESLQPQIKSAPSSIKEFWRDANKIHDHYVKDLLATNMSRDAVMRNEIYLGRYASTNMDEFLAEAFTEYRLSSEPSKFAKEVGFLIDKTFKK